MNLYLFIHESPLTINHHHRALHWLARRYPETLPPGVEPRETVDDALSAFVWGMYQIAVPRGTVSMTAMRDPLTLFRSIEHTAADLDAEDGDGEQGGGHEALKQKWYVGLINSQIMQHIYASHFFPLRWSEGADHFHLFSFCILVHHYRIVFRSVSHATPNFLLYFSTHRSVEWTFRFRCRKDVLDTLLEAERTGVWYHKVAAVRAVDVSVSQRSIGYHITPTFMVQVLVAFALLVIYDFTEGFFPESPDIKELKKLRKRVKKLEGKLEKTKTSSKDKSGDETTRVASDDKDF